jgi:predicted acylesterase/phospholipase RssA
VFHPQRTVPPRQCEACDKNTAPIGRANDIVRVLAFGGGGFDAVMQLGTIHALLVADAIPPDLVVGISIGAIHATALADVLKADAPLRAANATVERCREARWSRFRELLYEARDVRPRLRQFMLPDPFEADAGRALIPHEIANLPEQERSERQEALRARSGLVELFNTIAKLHISIATCTRFARSILGLRAAKALPFLHKSRTRFWESLRLIRTAIAHLPSTSQLLTVTLRAALRGSTAKRRGYSAGDIIFRRTRAQRLSIITACTTALMSLTIWAFPALTHNEAARLGIRSTAAIVVLGGVGTAISAVIIYNVLTTAFYLVAGVVLLLLLFTRKRRTRSKLADWLRDRVLAYYDLLVDLGSAYFVKDILVRFFDPTYHSERSENPIRARYENTRTFQHFADEVPRIHVAPVAARLGDGELVALHPTTAIVDGLAASVARLPYLRPVEVAGTYYIDGTNVANEPTHAVRTLLQQRVHSEATAVHLYPVSSLPVSAGSMPPRRDRPYTGLMDVLLRVRQLRRFRDAKLDREITALYDRMLPAGRKAPETKPDGQIRALKCFGNGRHYVRTTVHPIEPDKHAITLSERLMKSRNRNEEQTAIAETVAHGCRLTLQRLLANSMREQDKLLPCNAAVARRFDVPAHVVPVSPGALEVCKQCTLASVNDKSEPVIHERMVERVDPTTEVDWPIDAFLRPNVPIAISIAAEERKDAPSDVIGPQPPTVSVLFSGGVFRGVFLVGVLSGLQELGMQPNLLAGSSVGSITAAMAARIFSDPSPSRRRQHVADLAATYLSLDRRIITDRFADFIRRFTLRAAEARFTPKDIDNVFRSYDKSGNNRFERRARRVIAGLEHLLYVSPFELLALLRALRLQDARRAYRLVRRYFQELLDRGGVSLEILGTEPLRALISDHVLTESQKELRAVPIQGFTPLKFLVTVTNLTTGKLQLVGDLSEPATLIDALLASSAYPGVFRPRWGWEVFTSDYQQDQLVDGGVMDNLPLDAVVEFLIKQTVDGTAAVRPENAPHLIFTGSLERDPQHLDVSATARVARTWPKALRHAREHQYNRKIDSFARSQREFRDIYTTYANAQVNLPWVPLDIEVLVAKPRWLCGTFAFHPMLGFRRDRQAASISHGCATTLATFASIQTPTRKWLTAWRLNTETLSTLDVTALATLTPVQKTDGTCHFRSAGECPFSAQATHAAGTSAKVNDIYAACGKAATHQALP